MEKNELDTLSLDLWNLMQSYFEEKGLVRQHLDSYNEFIETELKQIIRDIDEIPIEISNFPMKIKLRKIRIDRPQIVEVDGSKHPILPMEARLRSLTYSAPMHLDVSLVSDEQIESIETVYIGDVPIMLKSNLCPLSFMTREELIKAGEDPADPGGYFIINGSERVIVALEDLAPNKILVDIDSSGSKLIYRAKVFSTTVGFRARIEVKLKPDGVLYVSIPGVSTEIPLVILMRSLGIESDKEIAEIISIRNEIQNQLEPSFEKSIGIDTIADAISYIGNRVAHGQIREYRLRRTENLLDRNLLPHVGRTPELREEKAFLLGEIAQRLIELKLGYRIEDDKDHYANKRLRLAGPLLSDLFRIAFRNLFRDIKYQLERITSRRKKPVIAAAVRPGIITDRVQHAIATGNLGHGRIGITQLLNRTNHISTLSHLRRLQSPLSRSQPNFEARDLHSTHWGRLCPNETPEGSNCGLVKNLSLMSCISVSVNNEEIKQTLLKLGVINIEDADVSIRRESIKVFVDGRLIGFSFSPQELVNDFRHRRRMGEISSEVNIVYLKTASDCDPEININCDAGRVRRPLVIVENGKPKITKNHITKLKLKELYWNDLIDNGLIEYLDADEEENAYIALNWNEVTHENTHVEIAPYTIFGISTSIIPYAEHNQSPRNSYEAAMAKQALGIYGINYFNRVDSRSHIMHYPQIPIVTTKPSDVLGYNNRPSGQNFVLAVMSYEGYNMQDAIILNKASIDRGLGRSTFFRVYNAEGRQYLGGLKDKFEIPESGIRGYRGEQYYRLIEEDGVVSVESTIDGGDVLIGKTSPPRFLEEYKEFEVRGPTRRDTSVSLRPSENGIVDDVFIIESIEGSKDVKVRVRDQRIPEVGDKFASRHGQKGVVGMIVKQEDMPFSESGIIPDAIINPHAFPSRMTIGQFLESLAGKSAALNGNLIDGTPFDNITQSEIRRKLQNLGFQHSGTETMYNGITGEKIKADIFIGIVYYQKLHHMVADKMHARARGQVQMLTRQPTEGRARGGGLRFGEMERDCLIGHGAALLLKDRLLEESDKAVIQICEECGNIAYYDYKQRKYVCKACGEKTTHSSVAVSYAFKLLVQEMMSLCISPKLLLQERA